MLVEYWLEWGSSGGSNPNQIISKLLEQYAIGIKHKSNSY